MSNNLAQAEAVVQKLRNDNLALQHVFVSEGNKPIEVTEALVAELRSHQDTLYAHLKDCPLCRFRPTLYDFCGECSAEYPSWKEKLVRAGYENKFYWSEMYSLYLTSPKWKTRRNIVKLRDGGLCQGCRQADATQVHHLTYQNAGDELLFQLVSICDTCHAKAHPDKK